MKFFIKQQSDDLNLDFIQDNIEQVLKSIPNDSPIIDGQYLEGISIITGTPKVINHQLGRTLKGWFIGRKSTNSVIWDSQTTNANPTKTLILNSSANITISIWVF